MPLVMWYVKTFSGNNAHSFIFSSLFALVRVALNPELIPRTRDENIL